MSLLLNNHRKKSKLETWNVHDEAEYLCVYMCEYVCLLIEIENNRFIVLNGNTINILIGTF